MLWCCDCCHSQDSVSVDRGLFVYLFDGLVELFLCGCVVVSCVLFHCDNSFLLIIAMVVWRWSLFMKKRRLSLFGCCCASCPSVE